jgi:hypothetical protein
VTISDIELCGIYNHGVTIIIGWLQEIIKQLKFADQFRKPNLKSKPIRNRFQLLVNGLAEKPDSNSEVTVKPVLAEAPNIKHI